MPEVDSTSAEIVQQYSIRAPLRVPIYRAVWVASMLTNVGAAIQAVGASWMMASITGSAHMVALVQSAVSLPMMLLTFVAGTLADTLNRRKIMLTAQVFMLVMSVALSICAWSGLLTPWLLLGFTFAIGCGIAVNAPTWQASVGDLVPRTQLPAAIALNSIGYNIARSLGPALGGLVVASAGFAATFAVNAVSYLALITVLAGWRPPLRQEHRPSESLGSALMAGVKYAAASPTVRTVLLRGIVFGTATTAVTALLPLVARDLVGGGPRTYGLLLAAFGLGAVAGALVSARLRSLWSSEAIVTRAAATLTLTTAVVCVRDMVWLTVAALLVSGAAWILTLSTLNATVQMSVPRWVVGRSLSLYQVMTFGSAAFSSWAWGAIATAHGLTVSILLSAGIMLASVWLGRAYPLPRLGESDRAVLAI